MKWRFAGTFLVSFAVLMVLWARKGSVDALILEELLPDGEQHPLH